MEIDPPHESDGSTTGSKENEIYLVSDSHSGLGLPYAPEDFPKPGDKWGWKVGKRVAFAGHYIDRYLYLPDRLYKEYKSGGVNNITSSRGFASKASIQRFLMEAFPGTDLKAFFSSFTWKIPAGKIKGNTDVVSDCAPKFDPAGCKAGNVNCSSLLELNDSNMIMACDICCTEPLFCHDCCCILCSKTVNSANGDQNYIRCEAVVKDGLICGHICHIECALRSYLAGTVGGSIGLDAEYYCRRCDARTDLIPHVKNLIRSCENVNYGDKLQKILNLCVIILRGSTKTSAKSLLNHVQTAIAKLKEGSSHEDIWKLEDTSAVTTGKVVSEHWVREEHMEECVQEFQVIVAELNKEVETQEVYAKLEAIQAESDRRIKAAEDKAASEMERVRVELAAKQSALEKEVEAKEASQVDAKCLTDEVAALQSELSVTKAERDDVLARLEKAKESFQELSDTYDTFLDEHASLVSGIPELVKKLRKSSQYLKPYGALCDVAIELGRHHACRRIKDAMPDLPESVFGNMVDPSAFQRLKTYCERIDDMEYPYLQRLATMKENTWAEISAIDPNVCISSASGSTPGRDA